MSKLKFGAKVRMQLGFDVWQATQLTQTLEICRLEPHGIVGYEGTFGTVKLVTVTMTQTGIERVPNAGTRMGIEPYAYPSSYYDKHDAKALWLHQWCPQSRIEVAVRNLNEDGAVPAMNLLCKAQEFTETGWNKLHMAKYAPIYQDDFVWGHLDIFTRLMLGLHSQGVLMVEGYLQDYQSVSKFQFSAIWIKHMWDTSEMLRGLSQADLEEGALSA